MEAAEASSRAELQSRAADLERAKRAWESGQQLFEKGRISALECGARKSAYEKAVAAVADARASVALAQAQVARALIGISRTQLSMNCGAFFSVLSGGNTPVYGTQAMSSSPWGEELDGPSRASHPDAQLVTLTFTADEQRAKKSAALEPSAGCH
jgi:hypothetical protein